MIGDSENISATDARKRKRGENGDHKDKEKRKKKKHKHLKGDFVVFLSTLYVSISDQAIAQNLPPVKDDPSINKPARSDASSTSSSTDWSW